MIAFVNIFKVLWGKSIFPFSFANFFLQDCGSQMNFIWISQRRGRYCIISWLFTISIYNKHHTHILGQSSITSEREGTTLNSFRRSKRVFFWSSILFLNSVFPSIELRNSSLEHAEDEINFLKYLPFFIISLWLFS